MALLCPSRLIFGTIATLERAPNKIEPRRYIHDQNVREAMNQAKQLRKEPYNPGLPKRAGLTAGLRLAAALRTIERLKTLKSLTPYEYISKIWTKDPNRFKLDPLHHVPGLNT